jgi:hypothetical protein
MEDFISTFWHLTICLSLQSALEFSILWSTSRSEYGMDVVARPKSFYGVQDGVPHQSRNLFCLADIVWISSINSFQPIIAKVRQEAFEPMIKFINVWWNRFQDLQDNITASGTQSDHHFRFGLSCSPFALFGEESQIFVKSHLAWNKSGSWKKNHCLAPSGIIPQV